MDDRSLFDPDALPEDLREVIKPELAPGERLLWAGRANERGSLGGIGLLARVIWALGFLIVSTVCFAGLFGAFGRQFARIDGVTATIGLISGIIGFLFLISTLGSWVAGGAGRSIVQKRCYALTDRRAIVWIPRTGSRAVEVHSFARGRIKDVHRAEYPDGSGDVILTLQEPRYDEVQSGSFLGVAEVRRVEDLVRRVLIAHDSQNSA
jgi:hypothetical protein